MDLREARRVLGLPEQEEDGSPPALTAEALRKQYLRLALRTHPDKNRDPEAAERFKQLGTAHAALLEAVQSGAAARQEQEHAAALLALLLRALQGEDVSADLRALGEYQPPALFGIDLGVRFDSRIRPPPPATTGESVLEPEPGPEADLQQVFHEMFQQDGLTEEGDPVGGYELPLEREV